MGRRFAIGDIHGCKKTLKRLLKRNLEITTDDEIILMGDLIDRGPRIRELIDYILKLREKGFNIKSILGNHEWLLLKSIDSGEMFDLWMRNKAITTLKSFHANDAAHIPEIYLNFFREMPYYIETEKFILVHGGLNFKKKRPLKHKKAMVWTRNNFVDSSKIGNKKIIVGHTPTPLKILLQSNLTNRVLTDGGCIYKGMFSGIGYLVAYELDKDVFHYEPNVDF